MKTSNGEKLRWPFYRLIILQLLLFTLAQSARAFSLLPPPDTNAPPWLNFWSFTDTNDWTSDNGYPAVSFTNLAVSDLGDGSAVVVDTNIPAWLKYNVYESDGTTNLTVNQGSVELWFAPKWNSTNEGGSGPGQWGRLIEVGSYTTNASYGWWSLYTDPAGANLYFTVQSNNGSQGTYLSAPIAWTTNYWHFIALTYSTTNTALYLDGVLATNGPGLTYWPGHNVLTNGFYLGSDNTGVAQAHGMLDDVATYNYPLDSNTVAGDFGYEQFPYYLNPANFANISSAPSTPSYLSSYDAISGSGYLQWVTNASDCVTSTNVWMTNVVAAVVGSGTNITMHVTFTIEGGQSGEPYDVFATAALENPITNAVWAWMGQGYHCNIYT